MIHTLTQLHPNYEYMLNWVERLNRERPGARILDFGCGSGRVVAAGRRRGWDVYGADAFSYESEARQEIGRAGLEGVVREMREGRLPFEDESFDLVLSNTVFEHVHDLKGALDEIHRVLRRGGRLVAIFPTREVLREGHFGVFFLHWFPKGSALRRAWTALWAYLGMGYHRDEVPDPRKWIDFALDWVDRYTIYRSRSEVLQLFGNRFGTTPIEEDYIRFRLQGRRRLRGLASLLRIPWAAAMAREFCRRWGGLAMVGVKKTPIPQH